MWVLVSCVPDSTARKCKIPYINNYLPEGIPVEWRVSNQMFSVMNDIRYVIFTGLLDHQ